MPHESCLTQKGTVAHVDQFFFVLLLIGNRFFLRSVPKKCPSIERQTMLFEYSRSEIDWQRKAPYNNLASISLKAGFQQLHVGISLPAN